MICFNFGRYIAVEDIPICYGGFKRENDTDFSAEDGGASEINIKSGSTETVEIPAPEVFVRTILMFLHNMFYVNCFII